MDFVELAPYIGLALGVLGRVIIPWLILVLTEEPPPVWNWRKVTAQLLTGTLAFIGLVAANPQLPTLTWQQALALALASAAAGWGFADMGREVKKASA